MFLLFLCLSLVSINSVLAQFPLSANETCESCKSNVTWKPAYGIWYLVQHIPFSFMIDSKCIYINVTYFNATASKFELIETKISDGSRKITTGIIVFPGKWDGSLEVLYTNLEIPFKFQVIAVDADSIAIVTCVDCGLFSKNGTGYYVQIYTRTQFPSCDDMKKYLLIFGACGIPPEAIKFVDQSGCLPVCLSPPSSSSVPSSS